MVTKGTEANLMSSNMGVWECVFKMAPPASMTSLWSSRSCKPHTPAEEQS